MLAHTGDRLVDHLVVVAEVGDHAQPRLHLVDHIARRVVIGVHQVDREVVDLLRDAGLKLHQLAQVRLQFGDEHIGPPGVLRGQPVRAAIPGPHERQAVPVQPVRRGPVHVVRPPPVADRHSVLVVADAVVVLVVELVDLDLVALAHRPAGERLRVPVGHLLHALDHLGDALVRPAARRAVYPQRLPPRRPRREAVQVRQLAVVIHVQVGDEDVVDVLDRYLERRDVPQAPRAKVEEQPGTVAQLDHDAGRRLVPLGRERARAHERDPHLIWPELLKQREEVARAHHARRGLEIRRQRDPLPRPPAVDARGGDLAIGRPGCRVHFTSHIASLLTVARCAVVLLHGVATVPASLGTSLLPACPPGHPPLPRPP